MFNDNTQYEGNQAVDSESDGFVPIEEAPVDYLGDLKGRMRRRDAEDAKPRVDEYRNSLPGPSPDPEFYDYPRMLDDNMQPKLGGEGVSPFPSEYYAKGHEPFDEWVMDANTGTYQPGNATSRVAIGAARDIVQGSFEYLLQGSSEDIMSLSEGAVAGGKILAGVGVKALTDAFADNPDPASYDNIIDDALASAHEFAYNPPKLPEIAGGDPETAKGMIENIGRDLSILLGGVIGGNKALPAEMFAVEMPKLMNWYRKTQKVIQGEIARERGVIVAEAIYSKVGEGGNLSTLLNDMGYGNALTEALDSSIEGEEDQMAMRNIIEGYLTSKSLQAFAATGKSVYRYAKAGGFSGVPVGSNQVGMVNFKSIKEPTQAQVDAERLRLGDVRKTKLSESKDVQKRLSGIPEGTEFYHGTNADFESFDPSFTPGGTFWFTRNKDAISSGESGASGTKRIITANLDIKRPAGWAEYDKYSIGELETMGYDSVVLDDNVIVFNKEQIKESK